MIYGKIKAIDYMICFIFFKKTMWYFIKYFWIFAVNIFTLLVVISIFDSLYDDFHILIVSINIIIYLNLVTFSSSWRLVKSIEMFWMWKEFLSIKRLLTNKQAMNMLYEEYLIDDTETTDEIIEKQEKQTKESNIKYYINAVFILIIYIICLSNLFEVIDFF